MTVPHTVTPKRAQRTVRVLLGGIGVAVIVLGGVLFADEIPAVRYPGVALWSLGAIVVHDGIIAGVVVAAGVVLRVTPWRASTKAVLGGAAVVGGILALVVVPAAVKAAIGTANPTILPFDYGRNLVLVETGIVIAAGAVVGVLRLVRARRRVSPGSDRER